MPTLKPEHTHTIMSFAIRLGRQLPFMIKLISKMLKKYYETKHYANLYNPFTVVPPATYYVYSKRFFKFTINVYLRNKFKNLL